MSMHDHGEFDLEQKDYTFEEIPLGSTVTYRGAGGIMKDGRVVAKTQALKKVWRDIVPQTFRPQRKLVEITRTSITLEKGGQYHSARVNLTQFKNVRSVK